MLINNQVTTEEIKEKMKKHLEKDDNENMMTQNLWDAAKTILQSYLKKKKIKSQLSMLSNN